MAAREDGSLYGRARLAKKGQQGGFVGVVGGRWGEGGRAAEGRGGGRGDAEGGNGACGRGQAFGQVGEAVHAEAGDQELPA